MKFGIIIITIITSVVFFLFFVSPAVYSFLAINRPVPADVLVIESWLFDYMLDDAVKEFNHGNYKTLIIAGRLRIYPESEIPKQYSNNIERVIQKLRNRGIDSSSLYSSATSFSKSHSTLHSAKSLKTWLNNNKPQIESLNVFTGGSHGRKSYHIFKSVLGKGISVGIISCEIQHYNPRYWWTSWRGTYKTTWYIIGYFYAFLMKFLL